MKNGVLSLVSKSRSYTGFPNKDNEEGTSPRRTTKRKGLLSLFVPYGGTKTKEGDGYEGYRKGKTWYGVKIL